MAEIKAYAFSISMDEAWEKLYRGGKEGERINDEICAMPGFIGVHPSDVGFVAYAYKTLEEMVAALKLAEKYFSTAAAMIQIAYINEDDLKTQF